MSLQFEGLRLYRENKKEFADKFRQFKRDNILQGQKFINPTFKTVNSIKGGLIKQEVIFEYDGIGLV